MRQTLTQMPKQFLLKVKDEVIKYFSSLPQFQGVPDENLIRLAKQRTGLHVPDRWVAIALLRSNRPQPCRTIEMSARASGRSPASTKLELIIGGRIDR